MFDVRKIFRIIILIFSFWVFSSESLTIPFEELARSYDSTARPKLRGSLMVNVSVLINSLEIDDQRQVLRLSGEVQQEWDDIHLRFSSTTTHQTSIGLEGRRGERIKDHLWLPDITIAEGTHSMASAPRDYLKIESDGHMTWTQQILYEFPCNFDYTDYPMGIQKCRLKLQSLGYDLTEVEPRWASDESVHFRSSIVSLRYSILQVLTSSATVITIHRAKRQLQATIILKTVTGWTVKHTVLPFVAAVATAYLSFFINVSAITARITLGGLSLVIATIFHESTYNKLPEAPYTMAIEVFTGTCLTFIWVALAETVIVDVLSHLRPKCSPSASHNSFPVEHGEMVHGVSKGQTAALWIDRCLRVLYPITFLTFNAVYWILYNSSSAHEIHTLIP